MKAISLWQPHATAIGLGLKPWETRGWSTAYRGPLAIHAAKRPWRENEPWDVEARQRLALRLAEVAVGAFPQATEAELSNAISRLAGVWLAFGAVVCHCEVVDCVRTSELRGRIPPADAFWGDFSDGEDGMGRWAFRLENVVMLAKPVPWRGQQGFFEVELPGGCAEERRMRA